jgi:hypothetical protein
MSQWCTVAACAAALLAEANPAPGDVIGGAEFDPKPTFHRRLLYRIPRANLDS